MTRTIRTGKSAYLPLGIIAGSIILLWVFVWIYRGSQTKAWQPILVIAGLYSLWCLGLWKRVMTIDDNGIACTYLIQKTRRISWSEIRSSIVTLWMNRQPFQILIYGSTLNKPLLDIPLKLYDKADVEFLMSLKKLKIENLAE